ncbi:MAG: hypothetical protein ACRDIE_10130 [Chloroflexota bacterium]
MLAVRGAFRAAPRHVPTLPPDTASISAYTGAAQDTPITLGIATELDDRLDPGIAGVLHDAGIRVLRFGGSGADSYDWETGCLYGDAGNQRECSGAPGGNGKLDQFLHFAALVGAQPVIVVNGEVDDPQQAARMVSYYERHCVHDPRQASRPCLQPYWEIGNSPAAWKHFAVPLAARLPEDAYTIQPDQYAALVVSYTAAMRRVSPCGRCIKIVADAWIAGATDQSWTDAVTAIDTHYAPLLYSPSRPTPSPHDIVSAVQNDVGGRPSIDSLLSDLRDSLDQFSNGQNIGIIVGQWSIDANALQEPAVYAGYAQAIFAAELIAHLWQDAEAGGPNPLLLALEYPLSGSAQEPFDHATGLPRPATQVYALVDRYLGTHPVPAHSGSALRREGVIIAAAVNAGGQVSLLLVNSDQHHAHAVTARGMPTGPLDLWSIGPTKAAGASPIRHSRLTSRRITLAPGEIAVARAG